MTTTTHPAGPGFSAAFITGDRGEISYKRYTATVNPVCIFNGEGNTGAPDPLDTREADAQLAAAGYLRVGDWDWSYDVWGCAVRQVTIPAGIKVRYRDHAIPVQKAIEILASGTSALTVIGTGEDGRMAPHLKASLIPVNTVFGHGARVALAAGSAYSPQVTRTRIAVYALAADIAEAANLIEAANRQLTTAGAR